MHTEAIRDGEDLIPIGAAAEILGVHVDTLKRWERAGRLVPVFRTPTGHRRYNRRAVEELRTDRRRRS